MAQNNTKESIRSLTLDTLRLIGKQIKPIHPYFKALFSLQPEPSVRFYEILF